MSLASIQKAIVAVVGAVVTILAVFAIDVDPEISATVVTLLTALAVYLVPNKQAPEPLPPTGTTYQGGPNR